MNEFQLKRKELIIPLTAAANNLYVLTKKGKVSSVPVTFSLQLKHLTKTHY